MGPKIEATIAGCAEGGNITGPGADEGVPLIGVTSMLAPALPSSADFCEVESTAVSTRPALAIATAAPIQLVLVKE